MSKGTEYITREQLTDWQGQIGKKKVVHEKPKTDYKAIFLQQLKLAGLPAPELELKFHPTRKWRFDFAWPEIKLAVEYHGIFGKVKMGHQQIQSLLRDYEKSSEAALLGWRLITITSKTVENGQALAWVERAWKS